MKNKIKRRSVTTELFIIYFLGYTCLSIIIFSSTNISFKIYKFLCSQRTYNSIYFDNLEDKLETNYLDVTDRDLSVIKGFLITINNDNKIDYHRRLAAAVTGNMSVSRRTRDFPMLYVKLL